SHIIYTLLSNTTTPNILTFLLYCSRDLRDLHSFPTRRSSDLGIADLIQSSHKPANLHPVCDRGDFVAAGPWCHVPAATKSPRSRSEEHTSELQSRFDLVCRLLLEKKKKNKNQKQQ